LDAGRLHSNLVAAVSTAIPRLFLSFCVLGLVLTMPSQAERKPVPEVGVAPPQPMDVNVRVRREGKTEIPLRIYGKANEQLKYLIRVAPEHGRLSEPRATDREVSVVVYEPPADLSITTDKFAYAVQSAVGVSAAVQLTITIVDQPPQLVIPDSIDFATVRTGATNSRLLEISNKGGLIASGEVIVDPPWKLEGKPGYHLGAGDVAVFKIIFAPTVGDKYEGVARYTTDREHSTTLRGVSEDAIATGAVPWVLQQVPGDPHRAASFQLTSQLDEPVAVQLKADARLKIPPLVQLPARGTAKIIVEAAGSDVQAWDSEIRLESADVSLTIPVHVPALGAIVRPTGTALTFGRLPVGKNATTPFEVENIGGAAGSISWKISAPFHIEGDSALLQPGEKKSFPMEIETKNVGHFRTWLEFTAGAQTFELPVEAEVGATASPVFSGPASSANVAATTTSAPSNSDPSESISRPEATDTNETPISPILTEWFANHALPKGVTAHHVTSTSAIVEWPASLSPAIQFRVEMQQLRIGPDKKLRASWLQPAGIPIETRGTNYAAIFTGLQPEQLWTIRIVPLEANGEAGPQLFMLKFYTPPKIPVTARVRGFFSTKVLVIILLFCIALQVWWRWQQRAVAGL
jgi:hypothetical protein